jgi:hypothetical protein
MAVLRLLEAVLGERVINAASAISMQRRYSSHSLDNMGMEPLCGGSYDNGRGTEGGNSVSVRS